jgi:hypothetical protein
MKLERHEIDGTRSTALYNYLRYGTLSSVRRVAELPCEHAE